MKASPPPASSFFQFCLLIASQSGIVIPACIVYQAPRNIMNNYIHRRRGKIKHHKKKQKKNVRRRFSNYRCIHRSIKVQNAGEQPPHLRRSIHIWTDGCSSAKCALKSLSRRSSWTEQSRYFWRHLQWRWGCGLGYYMRICFPLCPRGRDGLWRLDRCWRGSWWGQTFRLLLLPLDLSGVLDYTPARFSLRHIFRC